MLGCHYKILRSVRLRLNKQEFGRLTKLSVSGLNEISAKNSKGNTTVQQNAFELSYTLAFRSQAQQVGEITLESITKLKVCLLKNWG